MSGASQSDASSCAASAWGPGLVLGNLTLVRRVGVGGMAEVYEAEHAVLRSRVAIKRLHGRAGARPETVARFLREGRAAAAIRHPHVVQIFDVGTHEGAPYLVMEFLDGGDLEGHLAARGPLAVAEAVDLLLPVLSAVRAAHAEGVLHRDLKPSNVVLARDRGGRARPVVVDFGVARAARDLAEGVVTADEALLGTPAYLAPELCQGASAVSAASDQYALGVMLYQCLTGRRPFEAPSLPRLLAAIERNEYASPRALRGDVPEALDDVLRRTLARAPIDRHADVAAFARALAPFASPRGRAQWEALEASIAEHAPPLAPAPEAPPTPVAAAVVVSPPKPSRARTWAVAALAGAALLRPTAAPPRVASAPPPVAAPRPMTPPAAPPVAAPSVAPPAAPPPAVHRDPAPAARAAQRPPRRAIVRRANHPSGPPAAPGCIGPNGVNLCL
ncbi:MAG: serine/threonine-protein kinase [Polyangiales bacterium]